MINVQRASALFILYLELKESKALHTVLINIHTCDGLRVWCSHGDGFVWLFSPVGLGHTTLAPNFNTNIANSYHSSATPCVNALISPTQSPGCGITPAGAPTPLYLMKTFV